ncbi:MAG: T9SS type A sorting domain-containing protein [Candidatus Poribacteria bacterium]|nr:T9SS type A sorting domain-containing protein [Candidatus Poribacteria bacterium]
MRETLVRQQRLVIYMIALFLMSLFSGQAIAEWETTTYHWEKDEKPSGQETVFVPQPIEVEIENTGINAFLSSSASYTLSRRYKVYLSPQWDADKAYLLLQALQDMTYGYGVHSPPWLRSPSYWILSDVHVAQDIDLGPDVEVAQGSLRTITIASEAFTHAHPFVAKIDGIQGRYFSKRLWRAALRFATYIPGEGIQHRAIDNMLQRYYGVTVHVPDYEVLTGEPAHQFSKFTYEEILGIMIMFEEYPSGMHVTPGLKYLIRRAPDPFVKYTARANTAAGYIEFTDNAFIDGITHETQRIILHEKAHFLWSYLFDKQLKADWIELGEWYYDGERWMTTNQTEFVSDYAHGENPNEDMAESIAYYIVTPDKLRSRSPAKYEFIQNRIMHGTRYISTIRGDLTFVVYNLYPDYVYPGEVIRVDVTVEGDSEGKGYKQVEIEIETHTENELDYSTGGRVVFQLLDGDPNRPGRFFVQLRPVDAEGRTSFRLKQSNILRGHTTVQAHEPKGYYTITQVSTYDANELKRYNSGGFGLKIYINNRYEDLYPPEYVPNSAKLSVSDAYTERNEHFYTVTATWQVKEDRTLSGYTYIKPEDKPDYVPGSNYYLGGNLVRAGGVRHEGDIWTLRSTFLIPHYMPGGVHELKRLDFEDQINRESAWLPDIDEQIQKVTIETKHPDATPPTLDVNRITVNAEPANPANPNGETFVTVAYYVKDDISGFERGHIAIRDPLGGERRYNIWGPYTYNHTKEIYFQDDPNVYRKHTSSIHLPEGSFPGVWGVIGISVTDKASNNIYHDFTEITRFEVEEGAAAAPVIAVLPDNTQLLANYPNPFNPETWIPYQLAAAADVTLTIYAVDGKPVRTLALGQQPGGMYQSKGRAAYWNGRNEHNEPVASGLYFYTLTAGEFSETRKMLIKK